MKKDYGVYALGTSSVGRRSEGHALARHGE